MKQLQCLLYKNDCYLAGKYITPTHIVVHSTGANNKMLKRYVQPHSSQTTGMEQYKPNRVTYTRAKMLSLLGTNVYKNDWNRSGIGACVHAFIGQLADGTIATVQTLPWKMRSWGCGAGSKGSYNNCAIQFEICEDNKKDKAYLTKVYNEAVELCVLLCKTYSIKPSNIVSHKEACALGYASNHGDVEHWWTGLGFSMDEFRSAVNKKLNGVTTTNTFTPYKIKITANVLNVRSGAGTGYKVVTTVKKGEVYTIVEEKNGWGKLKSGAGWISLSYTKKV